MKLLQLLTLMGIAFLVGEYVTGTTKNCVYDYMGSQIVRTIPAASICPITIQVN